MKKFLSAILCVFIMIVLISGCKKTAVPTMPAATNTPNATQTVEAMQTGVINQQTIAAQSHTATNTATITVTPNMTETVAAMVSFVGAANATSTEQAAETQTAVAALWTATTTATITPTGTATATVTSTATITPTYTATATATITPTYTATATNITLAYSGLVSVPGGTYTQTDTGGDSFSHTISAFKIGRYEVTYYLWYTVYQWAKARGYTFANTGREGNDGTIGAVPTTAEAEPVTTISWRDVIVWCNAYSEYSGLTYAYYSDTGYSTAIKNTSDSMIDSPYVNWAANGYRLPTEGEWQYAASYKDGSSWTPYNYASGDTAAYDTSTTIGNYCWYYLNSSSVTHYVGGKTANALGIYDMSGNVYEWCWDWYGTYPTTASTNYRGSSASGSYRVTRGGSFYSVAIYLQVGYHYPSVPSYAGYGIGFRFARTY